MGQGRQRVLYHREQRHRRIPASRLPTHGTNRSRAIDAGRLGRTVTRPGLYLYRRRQKATHLHQQQKSLAPKHPRRLLGTRPKYARPPAVGDWPAAFLAHVRQDLARRNKSRLYQRTQYLCGRPQFGIDHRPYHGRHGPTDQRHFRLGLRRRIQLPRRLSLEPRQQEHCLLAA